MTDLDARADRLKEIAASLYGSLLSVDHDIAEIEIPADLSSACASMLGASGFSGYIVSQDCRQAPRRIADQDGRMFVVADQMATQAFYVFRVELPDRHARVFDPADPLAAHPAVAGITRPTKPFAG
jgi:hypothetical protein